MTAALLPVEFTPPLVAPASPHGLDAVTTWAESATDEALRWLPTGVQFRARSYRSAGAFGVWEASWCASPDDLTEDDVKTGPPPQDEDPDPYLAMTVWAFDRLQECGNLSDQDRREARERAEQTFALREPIAVETEFATRLMADAGTPDTATDIVGAVGHLEELFAATSTLGLIHARPSWLASAAQANLLVRDPATPGVLRTPGGQRWVFGGGYVTPLGDTLIATSPIYGWRGPVEVREAIQYERNQFVAIVERSVVVGYEAMIGTVEITG